VHFWTDILPGVPGVPGMPDMHRRLFEDRRMQFARTYLNHETYFLAIGMFDLDKRRATVVLDEWWKTRCELDSMAHGWIGTDWLIAERYGPIVFVDMTTCRPVLELDEHRDEAAARVRFDPVSERMISADRGGRAFLWDLRSGRATGILLAHSGEVVVVAPSPRRDRVLTASHDGTLVVWRAGDGARVTTATSGSELLAAAWIDDDLVATGDHDGLVRTIAPDTGTVAATRSMGEPISALAAAHGRLAVGSLGGDLMITDRALDGAIALAPVGPVTALGWSHDGGRLASGHAGGITVLWDTATGRELARRGADAGDDDRDGHASLVFSRDDTRLFAGRPDGTTLVVDARDLRDLASSSTTTDRVIAGLVLPPGPAGAILAGHGDAVLALARSANGQRLVSADLEGPLRVGDAATGAVLATNTTPRYGAATAIAFLDDDHVIVGHHAGAVRVHPVTASAALDRACALVAHVGRTAEVAPHCDRTHVYP
jgi:WD40 repeat protein